MSEELSGRLARTTDIGRDRLAQILYDSICDEIWGGVYGRVDSYDDLLTNRNVTVDGCLYFQDLAANVIRRLNDDRTAIANRTAGIIDVGIDDLVHWLTIAKLRWGAGDEPVTVGRATDDSGDIFVYQDGEYRARLKLDERPWLTDFDEPEE